MSQSPERKPTETSTAASTTPASEPQSTSTSPPQPGVWARVQPYVQPVANTVWLNARVWMPMLADPRFRACKISYGSREGRDGTKWDIVLPRQCWQCGARERLMQREYERQLRGFESPVGILVCTVAVALVLLLLALVLHSGTCVLLTFFVLLGGAAFMFVKSWTEQVRLVISTCPDHADALRSPLTVAYDNELHVVLPTEQLAQKAREELASKRRSDQRYSERSDAPPEVTTPGQSRRTTESYRRDELPPIKLDE